MGRGGAGGREPLVLPLFHALHLQAEGGEAGQEVGHLVHLRDKSEALSWDSKASASARPQGLLPNTTGRRAGIVSPPCDWAAAQGSVLDSRWPQTQRKGPPAASEEVGSGLFCDEGLAAQTARLALWLLPDPGPGPAATAHLLSGARHLEAGAQVVQPFPLLVPPQALQVLPQHLDDLKGEGRLGCGVFARRHREA